MRTRKVDVVDDLHGTKIADPYRWLEEADAPEVKTWTDAQNARTRDVLDRIPGRDALKTQIQELLSTGTVSPPAVLKPTGPNAKNAPIMYMHTKREGDQNQPVLYVRTGVHGADHVLIDPSTLSKDGTTALDWWYPSQDGALVAWGRSESGSEESTLFVRDVRTGADLSEKIPYTRHASIAWLPDGKGFYYSRHPEPGSVAAGDEKYFAKIFFHALGTDWKKDPLVFERPEKTDVPQVILSPNGRWLVVRVHIGWQRSEVFVRDRQKGEAAPWSPVAITTPAIFDPDPQDDRLYIRTNSSDGRGGGSRFRLFAIDYAKLARESWHLVLPEAADPLDAAAIIGDVIVATYMHDASTRLERFTKSGKSLGAIPLPGIGTASVSGAWNGDEAFVGFMSYATPPEVIRVDLKHGAAAPAPSETWDRVGANFKAPAVTVKIHYATSKDGTKIPMFVVSKEGIAQDGKNPTILWGYGGFNVNQTPGFSARALLTVERGGVWVAAILRGGGEFGEAWHEAGMLDKKQNVFDDFIACAETLIAEKVTSAEHLAILGGSNGGLLVAAAITQRPELFRAAASLVPLTDMLRFHRFRIGKLWTSEYGDPDDPKQFPTLFAYSPYHHVKDGTRYPATLFTTAESDSRVDPMHARKMSARMQEAQGASDRPILLRVESNAGHGAGKPISKISEELTDELSFLFHEIGMDR